MTEAEVFIAAESALTAVVDQIKDDQWALPLPEWFELGGTQDRSTLNLRKIVNYHAYDDAWVPDVLAGKTAEESVDSPKDMNADLLGNDPKASWHAIVERAVAAAHQAQPDRIVHLSYGDFPTTEYFKHITSFRGFRAYSIAKLIGVSTKLPDDLVQGMWDEISPDVEDWRKMGVFPAPIEVADDAPLQDRLLGMCGRDPRA